MLTEKMQKKFFYQKPFCDPYNGIIYIDRNCYGYIAVVTCMFCLRGSLILHLSQAWSSRLLKVLISHEELLSGASPTSTLQLEERALTSHLGAGMIEP